MDELSAVWGCYIWVAMKEEAMSFLWLAGYNLFAAPIMEVTKEVFAWWGKGLLAKRDAYGFITRLWVKRVKAGF